uniref:Uncharacterized protein n=1 Tax=Pseudomonas phage PACT201 TaxID=3230130 RepID=A0AAU8GS88_9VIRU
MLVIRFKGWSVKLDSTRWAALGNMASGLSTARRAATYRTWRDRFSWHAAIRPAEPKEGGEVEVFICDSRMPQDEWRAVGTGVAAYESDR